MANLDHPKSRHQQPPALKAKLALGRMLVPGKLSLGETYVTAQGQATPPLAAKVAPQAAALKQARDTLIEKIGERKNLADLILVKDSEIASADQVHDVALQDYAHGAVSAANGDLLALQMLAVTPVPTTKRKPQKGPPDAVEKVRLLPAKVDGSLIVKHNRAARAGIFTVEYKLEPSQPQDEWLAPESLRSRSTTHQIDGLAPAQLVRVRVRAFGDGWGPYSIEVVGRAR